MKKFWKVLGIAAIAAAVPVRFKRDEETGRKTYQSLLLSVDVDTDKEGKTADIGINLGDGLLTGLGHKLAGNLREADMFTDDPAEAAVSVDDLQAVADDLQDAADVAQAVADEAQAAADEAQAAADEAAEESFDPEA